MLQILLQIYDGSGLVALAINNLSDSKFYTFDKFSSAHDLFKRKWQAEALIYCTVLLLQNITDVLIF